MAVGLGDYFEEYSEGWFNADVITPDGMAVYSSGWWAGFDPAATPVVPSVGDTKCISNHEELTLARLIEQYKNKPNITAIIKSYITEQIQDIEDAGCGLYDRLNIDLMTGDNLDNIGIIVGQGREGQADSIYRTFLRTKIGVNNSQSSIEDIIQIWQTLTGSDLIEVEELFPATIQLSSAFSLGAPYDDLLKSLIEDILGAGVKLEGIVVYDADNAFAFEDSPNDINTGGFGSLLDLGAGGEFAGYI